MTSYGYARVSTLEQNPQLQIDELVASGIDPQNVYVDHASRTREDRPGLARALAAVGDGDCLTVWRLDRLGRSTSHLIRTVEALGSRGPPSSPCGDPVDTNHLKRQTRVSIFAAIAEFERQLIAERTAAGLVAAKTKGTPFWEANQGPPAAAQADHGYGCPWFDTGDYRCHDRALA